MVPKLSVIYQNITLSDKDIEFLYVGLDGQTKQEYDRFAASMPWPSVPFEETEARKTLEKFFHTPLEKKNGINSVAVLAEDHETIINSDAESYLRNTHDDTGQDFPWKATAAENLCAGAL